MKKLEELKKQIENIEVTYEYEEAYNNLYNTTIDYMNETQDFDFEYLFEDYYDYEIVEDIAKHELETGGLQRIYYFLGDANLNSELFRIDAYGNLTNVYKDDIEYLKKEILELINNKMEEE